MSMVPHDRQGLQTVEPAELQPHGVLQVQQSQTVALAAAVLDKRILTAKQFPRSVSMFKREAKDLLSEDIETARSAEYSKPVGGDKVRGPSVRLAEIACLCWKNIEVNIEEPIVGDASVTVQAYAWDLERNIRMPGLATMSILTKHGKRYAQHMIETTVVACASKARRNAILAVIPRAYVNDLLETARDVAAKNLPPLEETREKMLSHFARSYRVTPEQIFDYLAVKGAADITHDHVAELRSVVEALSEGEPIEGFFGEVKSKVDLAKEKLAERKSKRAANEEPVMATSTVLAAIRGADSLEELSDIEAKAKLEPSVDMAAVGAAVKVRAAELSQ